MIYSIGRLRENLVTGGPTKISLPSQIAGFIVCPILAICLYWIDSTVYVGLYGGAHLFVRILTYLLLDLFALTLIITGRLAMGRRKITLTSLSLSTGIIACAAIALLCFDTRPAMRTEPSFEGSLIWPLINVKYATGKILSSKQETGQPPLAGLVQTYIPTHEPLISDISRPDVQRVFLVILDALRADHLSCYGYERPTSPHIDAFAEESALFRYCIAPGCRTTETLPTIFTSRIITHLFITSPPDYKISSDTHPTVTQILAQNDFYTLGAGTLFPSYWGYGKGFQDWVRCPDDSILKKVAQKFKEIKKGKAFCYLHYIAVHDAAGALYKPARTRRFKEISFGPTAIDRYDTAVKLNDQVFEEFLEFLKKEGLYDDSVIILIADHGVGLGEHGYTGQARGFYNGEVLVPLIIKAPGLSGKVITETVGTIDLAPTILDLLGIERPASMEGRSLAPLMAMEEPRAEPQRAYFHVAAASKTAIVKGDYKLIYPGQPRSQLYAFKDDPMEQANLIADLPQVVSDLTREYEEMAGNSVRTAPLPAATPPDAGLEQGLSRKFFDNPFFRGRPVSKTVVVKDLTPQWNIIDVPPPEEGFSIEWEGYIYIPKCPYNKSLRFALESRAEIEMWINGVKIMDATRPQREHCPGYWEGYIPLAPGTHPVSIRLSERRKKGHPKLNLFYYPHGKKVPMPSNAFFHGNENKIVQSAD